MIHFSLLLEKNQKYVTFPFYKNGQLLKNAPLCGLTLKAASSMRFRWNEKNLRRESLLLEIAKKSEKNHLEPVSLELFHSRIVYDLVSGRETFQAQGDGMITKNPSLMPVVTVADCMPLYFYNSRNGLFGLVHSGWKGTGIIGDAIKLACKNYEGRPEDFSLVIGPHIRDCCYIVNEERAEYFCSNFGSDCVRPLEDGGVCRAGGRGLAVKWNNGGGKLYRLSLEKANLSVLEKAGIPEKNIAICDDCTCCNELLGSNRRETADFLLKNPEKAGDKDVLGRCFTVQAAFIGLI